MGSSLRVVVLTEGHEDVNAPDRRGGVIAWRRAGNPPPTPEWRGIPVRDADRTAISRRAMVRGLGASALAMVLAPRLRFDRAGPLLLGSGAHTYEWDPAWPRFPEGMWFGSTHGTVIVDGAGRVYCSTDTPNAVMIFEPDGRYAKSWGKDLAGGVHGMALVRDGGREYLWLAHIGRHEVLKTTLDGEVVQRVGYPEKSGIYASADQYRPTSVAVAPNGDVYVADGYGLSYIHHYSSKAEFLVSWGGPGTEPGKFRTPHGIWVDTRAKSPVLLVADRENRRLQTFGLEGTPIAVLKPDVRRPCHFDQRGTDIGIADLDGRVTILDKNDTVIAHLGEQPDPAKRAQNGVSRSEWKDGEFIAPHGLRWDAEGNLYVSEWLAAGRVVRLKRVK